MNRLDWQDALDVVKPYVVRISTPRGAGTGFLSAYSLNGSICALATAAHVICEAHLWEEPIRIEHYQSGQTRMLRAKERAIFIDTDLDTAAIVCVKGELPLPETILELTPEGKYLRIGNEIGWMGFPAISPGNLCFFSGRASAWLDGPRSYLVDGVVINGVSGGPAFFCVEQQAHIVGVVSAYIPNRATGDTLPGLCLISHVLQFQKLVKAFQSLDEAKKEETPPSTATAPDMQADRA